MIKLSRLLVFALLCCTCSLALAQAADTPAPSQDLAALWPMLGVSLASLAAYGIRKLSAEYTFFHSGLGAFVLALVGSVISSVTPVVQAHGFAWAALAWAAVGGLTAFVATLNPSTTADQPPAKSPAAAKLGALLPLLFIVGALSGCHGYKAPTYATLATLADGAAAAEAKIPPTCETLELKAVADAKDRASATSATATIHGRCVSAESVLSGIGVGLKTARDAVHDAPADAPSSAFAWIGPLLKQYCDARPFLAFIGLQLPAPQGVC